MDKPILKEALQKKIDKLIADFEILDEGDQDFAIQIVDIMARLKKVKDLTTIKVTNETN